jgi:cytochrome oxidase assembly protein ShyY1
MNASPDAGVDCERIGEAGNGEGQMTTPMAPEIFFGLGTLVLLIVIAWATWQYRSRNRANDPVSEQATEKLFRDPGRYDKREEQVEKGKLLPA